LCFAFPTFAKPQTVATQFICRIALSPKRAGDSSQKPKDSRSKKTEERITGERRRRVRNSFIKAKPPLTGKLQALFHTGQELSSVLFPFGAVFFWKKSGEKGRLRRQHRKSEICEIAPAPPIW
jgi:hypothetical protein